MFVNASLLGFWLSEGVYRLPMAQVFEREAINKHMAQFWAEEKRLVCARGVARCADFMCVGRVA